MKSEVPTHDTGLAWLGQIPVHWKVAKFSRAVFIAEGQVDPEDERYAKMLLVAPNHIESGTGRLVARETAADQAAISGKYLCQTGDVIYSKIRPALKKATLATEQCLCSADMYPLRAQAGLTSQFLLLLLLSGPFTAWAILESDRVAMPKINRESLSDLRIPIPPLPEQRAISDYLDRETARLDRLVAAKERVLWLLAEKRRALITRAVTCGLDPRAPLRDSGIPWLSEIPVHWDVQRLKFLTTEPLSYGANEAALEDDPTFPRFVRITDLDSEGNLRDETFKSLPPEVAEPYLLRDGDVLLARSGATVGKAFIYKPAWGVACFAGYLIRCRCNTFLMQPDFLFAYTQTEPYWWQVREGTIQATIQNFSAEKYGDLVVTVRPLEEQKAIIAYISAETTKLDGLRTVTERTIALLRERRSALIAAAVAGQLEVVVTDEDP